MKLMVLANLVLVPERSINLPRQVRQRSGAYGNDEIAFFLAQGEGLSQVSFLERLVRIAQQHFAKLLVDDGRGEHAA